MNQQGKDNYTEQKGDTHENNLGADDSIVSATPAPTNSGYNQEQLQGQPQTTREVVEKISAEMERKRLTGVGGWLILFIVLYSITMLGLLYNIFTELGTPNDYYAMQYDFYIEQPSPLWIAGDIFKAILIVVSFACMFMKKRITPHLCKGLVVLELIIGNLYITLDPDHIMGELFINLSASSVSMLYFALSAVYAAAWIMYFRKSKRVKYTFTQ